MTFPECIARFPKSLNNPPTDTYSIPQMEHESQLAWFHITITSVLPQEVLPAPADAQWRATPEAVFGLWSTQGSSIDQPANQAQVSVAPMTRSLNAYYWEICLSAGRKLASATVDGLLFSSKPSTIFSHKPEDTGMDWQSSEFMFIWRLGVSAEHSSASSAFRALTTVELFQE